VDGGASPEGDETASLRSTLLLLLDVGVEPPPGFNRETFGEYEVVSYAQRRERFAQLDPIF